MGGSTPGEGHGWEGPGRLGWRDTSGSGSEILVGTLKCSAKKTGLAVGLMKSLQMLQHCSFILTPAGFERIHKYAD